MKVIYNNETTTAAQLVAKLSKRLTCIHAVEYCASCTSERKGYEAARADVVAWLNEGSHERLAAHIASGDADGFAAKKAKDQSTTPP
jgi:hypothetical protein